MIIECYNEDDVRYKYIGSLHENNYVIKVNKIVDGYSTIIKCDYYDTEGAGLEVLSLGNGEHREIIQANDIEDCPTLKGFYIVRE